MPFLARVEEGGRADEVDELWWRRSSIARLEKEPLLTDQGAGARDTVGGEESQSYIDVGEGDLSYLAAPESSGNEEEGHAKVGERSAELSNGRVVYDGGERFDDVQLRSSERHLLDEDLHGRRVRGVEVGSEGRRAAMWRGMQRIIASE